jgi:anti-sigma B factor antagonist
LTIHSDSRPPLEVEQPSVIGLSVQGTTSTITLTGECDLALHERFGAVVREALAARPECVVLDLSDLHFIDSTGIQVVIELNAETARDGVRLVVCPGAAQVQRVFELCGLTSRLLFAAPSALSSSAPCATTS